jgi:hypothetical protein
MLIERLMGLFARQNNMLTAKRQGCIRDNTVEMDSKLVQKGSLTEWLSHSAMERLVREVQISDVK